MGEGGSFTQSLKLIKANGAIVVFNHETMSLETRVADPDGVGGIQYRPARKNLDQTF